MAEKAESNSSMDLVKWVVVAVIVGAAVYANSYFAAESLLLRIIGLLVAASVAGWIAVQTQKGAALWNLCLEARVEIRKVVWPSRQETTQQTVVVIVVIIVLALILWLLDWGLNGVVNGIIG